MYIPKPIDTSHIELPEDLLALTEKIAENVHEVWSQNRIAEGGPGENTATTQESRRHALSHMPNCRRKSANMTAKRR